MSKTILVVEDYQPYLQFLTDWLETLDYKVVQATDGAEVVDLVRTRRPDLIFMDIQLPSVSGVELIQQIKSDPELDAIPIFAVTAFIGDSDRDAIVRGGCDELIFKPVDMAETRKLIFKHLKDRSIPA